MTSSPFIASTTCVSTRTLRCSRVSATSSNSFGMRAAALGVVTVKGRAAVDLTFSLLKLNGLFDTVVTSDDTIRQKPAPDPLLAALKHLGSPAATAAYVGDAPFDVQAARAAGLRAIAVSWGGIHPRERLVAEQPDVIINAPYEVLDVV